MVARSCRLPSTTHYKAVSTILTRQVGPDEVRSNALVEALAQLARRAAFNQLRTIEQLGYIVFLSAWSNELIRSLVRADSHWCEGDPAFICSPHSCSASAVERICSLLAYQLPSASSRFFLRLTIVISC